MQDEFTTQDFGFQIVDQNFEEMKKYWMDLYETEELGEDETIRIVPQIKKPDGSQMIFTINNQIRTFEQFASYVRSMDSKNGVGSVGYSISSSVFRYDPNLKDDKGNVVKPTTSTFNRIKKVVIDVDFYISGTKDRFILGHLEEEYMEFALATVYLTISEKFKENDIDIIRPISAGMTGSGLQIIFDLDRWLNKDEANTFFAYLKKILGTIKTDVLIKDVLGNLTKITAEIDSTFADIAHVQRVFGTINQKYQTLARSLPLFSKDNIAFEENIKRVREHYLYFIKEEGFPLATQRDYEKYVNHVLDRVFTLIVNESFICFNVEKYLVVSKMQQYQHKTMIKPSELKNIETELLYKLKENNIRSVDVVREHVVIDHESSSFIALKCPFHDDSKYSFAIYINDTIDIFYDFHDSKSYTLISFWEKLFEVNKTTAISQIAQKAGIKLGKTERKDFEELEIEEIVDHLLDKVNTDDFVYYRLANKNRVCIVRHKDSGEAFVFDGPRMMATHIMQNQLNIIDADKKFISVFVQKFQEKLLIDAFEEFSPGKPTVFSREFIKFVNLWVPSRNYKLAHEVKNQLANEFGPFTLDRTLSEIEEKCPWTFKYILQITQKGNIKWFINWLASSSQFKVMPVIPVVFGVPGVGKNLFVSTIIEWYHNSEYTKVLNSDRVMSNFNSMLEDASFVVLDEGDISGKRDFDALKFLSGNDKIAIEKKGVDTQMKQRYFNIILFSNGDVPVRHGYDDRRIQYFSTEQTLLQSCKKWNISIEEFIKNIKKELHDFWGILLNTKLNDKWSISNEKDKLFIIQILKQHGFGELILKLLRNDWKDIALQLSENTSDAAVMKSNLELLNEIKGQFQNEGEISLTLINRYLNSLNYKYKTSIQQFLKHNNLGELGLDIKIYPDEVKIVVDKDKLNDLTTLPNLLDIKKLSKGNITRATNKLEKIDSELIQADKVISNIETETDLEYLEDSEEEIMKEAESVFGGVEEQSLTLPEGIQPPPMPPKNILPI